MMDDGCAGIWRALLAVLLGGVLALAAPHALAGVTAVWQQTVLLSLTLACALLAAAGFILALVAQIAGGRSLHASERLVLLADIFLIATAGMGAVLAIFSFVLALLRIA